jgi:Uncharacterised nucleotidyltransferase
MSRIASEVGRTAAGPPAASLPAAGLWRAAERVVGSRLGDPVAVCMQGLGPLAGELLERRGAPIPLPILQQQRMARVGMLAAPAVLARAREAWPGMMLLLKGPEVAARYPERARGFADLDLLVPDAREVQRSLLAAGFVEEEDPEGIWVGIHHLPPVRWPGLPLIVELHSEPKWPSGLVPPRKEELFEAAVPAAVGVTGMLAPAPAHHAVLLAAHAWAHQPLGRARDFLDVGALAVEADRTELERLARAWGVARVWSTTSAALDAFLTGRKTVPLHVWAGHLSDLRVQTVLEHHLERMLSPFWGLPPATATRHAACALGNEFRPAFDETWGEKVRRSAAAVRRAFVPLTMHRSLLGESATRGRRRNRPPE